jgi:UDP-glucuronate 4-epimerase
MPTDRPLSPYAASKKAAELACYTYHELHNIDVTVLRFFTVYGPAGRPDMSIFRFVRRISQGKPITVFGDGLQQRDFTYVGDISRGVVASLKPLGYETINLGSDRPLVLRDVIGFIEKGVGQKAVIEYQPRHPADVSATWADITKAKELLDWQPEVSFEDGLANSISWFQENEGWAGQLLE